MRAGDRIFFVGDFELSQIGGQCIASSRSAVVRITDPNMKLLFEELQERQFKKILESEIAERCLAVRLPTKEAIQYLEKTARVIRDVSRIANSETGVERVKCFTDIPLLKPFMVDAAQVGGVDLLVEPLSRINENLQERTLVCILMKNYAEAKISDAYEAYKNLSGTWFLTSYFTGGKFVIDGLYDPLNGSPCHFCHIHRWKNLVATTSQSKGSWLDLISDFSNRQSPLVGTPATELELLYVAQVFIRRILYFSGLSEASIHLDSVYSMSVTDPIECTTNFETVAHWSHCKCAQDEVLA
jgi:McbB family protein